jgi:hypothetical protein
MNFSAALIDASLRRRVLLRGPVVLFRRASGWFALCGYPAYQSGSRYRLPPVIASCRCKRPSWFSVDTVRRSRALHPKAPLRAFRLKESRLSCWNLLPREGTHYKAPQGMERRRFPDGAPRFCVDSLL